LAPKAAAVPPPRYWRGHPRAPAGGRSEPAACYAERQRCADTDATAANHEVDDA
jgi:hypothetical protein